jgi:Brp/Blh family beta-carotene 15,15'-monooxygenase
VTASRAALAGVLVLFVAARLLGETVPLRTQAAVYLVGMVALNLPHGGYEHVANLRRRARRFRGRYVAGYLLLAGAFLGLFRVAPVAGLALAVAVAAAKGGGGDLYVLAATTGTDHLRTRGQRLLAVVARGGAVMAVPVVAFPATFQTFGAMMVGLVDPGGFTAVAARFDAVRALVGGAYAAAVLGHLGLGYRRRPGTGAWVADAAETALLVAYFAVVPVVIAVGLYFPLWYSTRQVARELAVEEAPAASEEGARTGLALLAVGAATAAVAAGFWLAVPNPLPAGPLLGGVAFWSVFISVIALPHVVVGSVLDRGRGIWHVP